jgi:hypothetical protein
MDFFLEMFNQSQGIAVPILIQLGHHGPGPRTWAMSFLSQPPAMTFGIWRLPQMRLPQILQVMDDHGFVLQPIVTDPPL